MTAYEILARHRERMSEIEAVAFLQEADRRARLFEVSEKLCREIDDMIFASIKEANPDAV